MEGSHYAQVVDGSTRQQFGRDGLIHLLRHTGWSLKVKHRADISMSFQRCLNARFLESGLPGVENVPIPRDIMLHHSWCARGHMAQKPKFLMKETECTRSADRSSTGPATSLRSGPRCGTGYDTTSGCGFWYRSKTSHLTQRAKNLRQILLKKNRQLLKVCLPQMTQWAIEPIVR